MCFLGSWTWFLDVQGVDWSRGTCSGAFASSLFRNAHNSSSLTPASNQHIHTDDVIFSQPRPHPDLYLNVILALSEFTEENGATHVLPGSHRFDRE
jgi:ectoine hydroxylase-related dioxygenase (phytanoyl-CoA dioxygenase family)